jgi:hypothetical protein
LDDLEVIVQGRLDGRVHEFRLELRDGCLVLQGVAHTYQDRELARALVEVAAALPVGENEIVVL